MIVFVFFLFVGACCDLVLAEGVFELDLIHFNNTEGKDELGNCCNPGNCSEGCKTFFRICVTHVPRLLSWGFRRRIDPSSPCSFGFDVTDVIAANDLTKHVTHNYTFNFNWPGRFFMIVEAWHSTNISQVPNEDDKLIMRFVEEKRLKVSKHWTYRNKTSDSGQQAFFAYRVTCTPGYTGQNCKEECPSEDQKNNTRNPFNCTATGEKICNQGWLGEECDKPVCKSGCHEDHGYCKLPDECRCRLGWSGELCDQCVPMPGCQNGFCNRTFECHCRLGWDGFFCSQPICKEGCHQTRGFCEGPNECRCRIGWQGERCEDCKPLPGCVHGYCNKPLDCVCDEGWSGVFCSTPICTKNCDVEHGYCLKPNECRCRMGWHGQDCDQCFPYPNCKNGNCTKPWECTCHSGWGGQLCDIKLEYCEKNQPCQNGGTCVDRTADDGYYFCKCPSGLAGSNCTVTAPAETKEHTRKKFFFFF